VLAGFEGFLLYRSHIDLQKPEKWDTIYAAIGGAAIAVLGSLVTSVFMNSHALKRLRLELQDAKSARESEREYALKREVYLAAFEAMSGAFSFLQDLASMTMEQRAPMTPLEEYKKQFYRVQLIASEQTLEAFHRISTLISKAYAELAGDLTKLHFLATDTNIAHSRLEALPKKISSVMDKVIEHATVNAQSVAYARSTLKQLRAETSSVGLKVAELFKKEQRLRKELRAKTREAIAPLNEVKQAAVVAVRTELKLPFDRQWLDDVVRGNSEELRRSEEVS
jgi:hypothetical protein